ncbi:lytic transglycosylase domain-containing protein [Streptosporangium sp. NPDC051022]|uniref:aggregation-promoting factor C-terminal-like domain-containing protein n=1 Tax=Streptosporangium sp. NPDC051022 TaxID=3155752 RepID=UPI00344A9E06
MNSYRVLRNTVLTVLAASTVVGSTAVGRAEESGRIEEIEAAEESGSAGNTGRIGETGLPGEATTTGEISEAQEIAAPPARVPAMRIHRAVWVTRAKPKVRRAAAPSRSSNKAIAFRLVARRSWSQNQFQCLDSLWTRESNWDHEAHNPSSGAYGIPQALPGSKMSGSGGDWRSNPVTQIHWGLRYIKSRYGSPCGAWGHFRSSNWY